MRYGGGAYLRVLIPELGCVRIPLPPEMESTQNSRPVGFALAPWLRRQVLFTSCIRAHGLVRSFASADTVVSNRHVDRRGDGRWYICMTDLAVSDCVLAAVVWHLEGQVR